MLIKAQLLLVCKHFDIAGSQYTGRFTIQLHTEAHYARSTLGSSRFNCTQRRITLAVHWAVHDSTAHRGALRTQYTGQFTIQLHTEAHYARSTLGGSRFNCTQRRITLAVHWAVHDSTAHRGALRSQYTGRFTIQLHTEAHYARSTLGCSPFNCTQRRITLAYTGLFTIQLHTEAHYARSTLGCSPFNCTQRRITLAVHWAVHDSPAHRGALRSHTLGGSRFNCTQRRITHAVHWAVHHSTAHRGALRSQYTGLFTIHLHTEAHYARIHWAVHDSTAHRGALRTQYTGLFTIHLHTEAHYARIHWAVHDSTAHRGALRSQYTGLFTIQLHAVHWTVHHSTAHRGALRSQYTGRFTIQLHTEAHYARSTLGCSPFNCTHRRITHTIHWAVHDSTAHRGALRSQYTVLFTIQLHTQAHYARSTLGCSRFNCTQRRITLAVHCAVHHSTAHTGALRSQYTGRFTIQLHTEAHYARSTLCCSPFNCTHRRITLAVHWAVHDSTAHRGALRTQYTGQFTIQLHTEAHYARSTLGGSRFNCTQRRITLAVHWAVHHSTARSTLGCSPFNCTQRRITLAVHWAVHHSTAHRGALRSQYTGLFTIQLHAVHWAVHHSTAHRGALRSQYTVLFTIQLHTQAHYAHSTLGCSRFNCTQRRITLAVHCAVHHSTAHTGALRTQYTGLFTIHLHTEAHYARSTLGGSRFTCTQRRITHAVHWAVHDSTAHRGALRSQYTGLFTIQLHTQAHYARSTLGSSRFNCTQRRITLAVHWAVHDSTAHRGALRSQYTGLFTIHLHTEAHYARSTLGGSRFNCTQRRITLAVHWAVHDSTAHTGALRSQYTGLFTIQLHTQAHYARSTLGSSRFNCTQRRITLAVHWAVHDSTAHRGALRSQYTVLFTIQLHTQAHYARSTLGSSRFNCTQRRITLAVHWAVHDSTAHRGALRSQYTGLFTIQLHTEAHYARSTLGGSRFNCTQRRITLAVHWAVHDSTAHTGALRSQYTGRFTIQLHTEAHYARSTLGGSRFNCTQRRITHAVHWAVRDSTAHRGALRTQ